MDNLRSNSLLLQQLHSCFRNKMALARYVYEKFCLIECFQSFLFITVSKTIITILNSVFPVDVSECPLWVLWHGCSIHPTDGCYWTVRTLVVQWFRHYNRVNQNKIMTSLKFGPWKSSASLVWIRLSLLPSKS